MRLLLLLIIPVCFQAQNLNLQNPLRILALGDSYTIGESVAVNERWPTQLRDSLAIRGITTQSLSYIATTGWRTDNLLNAVASQNLQNKNYNLVTLLIGVNNQFQGTTFSQYQSEFITLADSAIRYAGGNKSHVFIVSIPDYAYTPVGQQFPNPSQISGEINKYNNYNKRVADSLQITYFDITPISRQGLINPALVAGDGLHPSAVQYTEWVRLMLREIDKGISYTGLTSGHKSNAKAVITPHPFQGKFKVNLQGFTSQETAHFEIINATGSLVERGTLNGLMMEADLSDMPDGIYFLKIKSDKEQVLKKLIKSSGRN